MISFFKKVQLIVNGNYRLTAVDVPKLNRPYIKVFVADMFPQSMLCSFLSALVKDEGKTLDITIVTSYSEAEEILNNDYYNGDATYDIYILASRLHGKPAEKERKFTDTLWASIPINKLIVTSEDAQFVKLAVLNGIFATHKMYKQTDNTLLTKKITSLIKHP